MNEQSIEFGNLEDPVTPKISRKSFRIPVIDSDDIQVCIKDNFYKLADISMDGISFYLETEPDFTIDEQLNGCELNLNGTIIKNLSGTIVHFSQEEGLKQKYGIKWTGLTEEILKQIEMIFLEIKKEYLSKTPSESNMSE